MNIEDFYTATWSRLKDHFEQRIEELRELNDQLSNSETETAAFRGGIAELKRILELEQQLLSSSSREALPFGNGSVTEEPLEYYDH